MEEFKRREGKERYIFRTGREGVGGVWRNLRGGKGERYIGVILGLERETEEFGGVMKQNG